MKTVKLGILVIALATATAGTASAEPPRKTMKSAKKNDPYEAQRKEVARVKRTYMFAVDSCSNNQRCDEQLLRDAETAYLNECKICADKDKCEADRDTIKSGDGKVSFNPCAETTAAQASGSSSPKTGSSSSKTGSPSSKK